MKKIKTIILTVLSLVALSALVNAAENKSFKTNLTGSWTPLAGTWADSDKGKKGSDQGDAFCLNSQTGTDFIYEGDITIIDGVAAAGALVFRANETLSAGYCVNIDASGLVKLWAPGRGELAHSEAEIKVATLYHLKVVTSGSNIKVYFNNGTDAVINYTDETPLLSGQFGLNTYNGAAVFQNVNFTVLDAPKK